MTKRIDLSHTIEAGMVTFKGIPGPVICDFWEREASAQNYDGGESFQIGRVDMVANTGTYVDSPFHRYADGCDLSGLALESLADLDCIVVRRPWRQALATDVTDIVHLDVRGKAVLIDTGWDEHWRTPAYFSDHSFLTAAAAEWLVAERATFVGIDSHNIDDTRTRRRPVHSALLRAGIPIGEHLTNLAALPETGSRFHAVPPKIAGMGTFPVRAYAVIG